MKQEKHMKVEAFITNRSTGERRDVKDIPRGEWWELCQIMQNNAMDATGCTPMRGQEDKETA